MSSLSEDDAELPVEKIDKAYHTRRVFVEFTVALLFFSALSIVLTWPVVLHSSEILLGGGELGGWLWRNWWHFEEVESSVP